MDLQKKLQKLGLSEKESEIYLANLEIGSAAASVISRKTGLQRTTCYSVLQELHKKGFVTRYDRAKTQYFTALSGEEISKKLEREQQEESRLMNEILPQLNILHTAPIKPPKVQYFEGFEGIQSIYESTLKENITEKLAYSSVPDSPDPKLKSYIQKYVQKRKKKGMHVRAIFPFNQASKEFIEQDKNLLRTSRLAHLGQHQIKSEINIYGDKVAIMSLIPPHYHGVIIESPEIAETQKAIFELAWRGSEYKTPPSLPPDRVRGKL